MFLTATLSLNPSSGTEFDTDHSGDELKEHETFTTGRILQQLALTMRDAGITNAALLSHDGDVLFQDDFDQTDDLTAALRSLAGKTEGEARRDFDTLRLVLERKGELLHIVVDIRVERVHDIDAPPVVIALGAFLRTFYTDDMLSPELLRMFDPIFEEQSGYDDVCAASQTEFDQLVNVLQSACCERMELDEIEVDSAMRIIDTGADIKAAVAGWPSLFDHTCVTQGDVLYCYQWHQKCLAGGIELSDCELIDIRGDVKRRYTARDGKTADLPAPPSLNSVESSDDYYGDQPGALGDRNTMRGFTISDDRLPQSSIPFIGPFKRDVWEAVAREMGAHFVRGGFFRADRFVYQWEGHPIRLYTFSRTSGENEVLYTGMRVELPKPSPFGLDLYRAGFFTAIGKALGFDDIQIGDEWFDDHFVIKGRNPDLIRRFLACETLRSLIYQQPGIILRVDRLDIVFEYSGTIKNADRILRLFELFIEMLIRLETFQ